MTAKRRYRLLCPIARALDVVGDRWALLIVRDLHAGPARFQDLETGLGIATNLLTTRLTELTKAGVIEKSTDGCDWHTINDTVLAYGTPLVEDPDRIGPVDALGGPGSAPTSSPSSVVAPTGCFGSLPASGRKWIRTPILESPAT